MLGAALIVIAVSIMVLAIVAGVLYFRYKRFVVNTGHDETWSEGDGTSHLDIVYDQDTGNKVDIYIPANLNPAQDNGLILFVHGGEWVEGAKDWEQHNCYRYAKAGYITATVDYSLHSDENPITMFTMLDDIEAATHKIKELSDHNNWNIKKMAFSGASAGGHLSLLFAYSKHSSAFPVEFVAVRSAPVDFHMASWDFPGKHEEEIAVSLVNKGTASSFNFWEFKKGGAEEVINSISPLAMVDGDTVPTLMAYGARDRDQNPRSGEMLREKLNEYGVKNHLVEFPKSDNYLAGDRKSSQEYSAKFLEYLQEHFGY